MFVDMPVPLDLPAPSPRAWATLISSVDPDSRLGTSAPVRWAGGGITARPFGCAMALGSYEECDTEPSEEDVFEGYPDDVTFRPVDLHTGTDCSTFADWADLERRSRARMLSSESYLLARELITAELSEGTNPSLESVVSADLANRLVTDNAIPMRQALAILEEYLAHDDVLHGAAGVIHMPPAAFGWLFEEGAFIQAGDGNFYTPTGHLVIADAGYKGAAPSGVDADPGDEFLYTSGPITWQLADLHETAASSAEVLSPTTNDMRHRIQRVGIVAFDPCTVYAAQGTYATVEESGS